MILDHLDKNNFHHAYLIEGVREDIVPEIIKFCESLKIKTQANPDFCNITIDNFKIDDAFYLRNLGSDKGFSTSKKIFIICANTFTLDAENVLLKMFEEPIENTHFFLIVPDINVLLKTLISRFYLITSKSNLENELDNAKKFISMPLKSRLDFIKELLTETDEENEEVASLDSARSKSLKFLNALESIIHNKIVINFELRNSLQSCCQHFFKVREFLRIPGSSTKTLMESVALVIPDFSK